MLVCMQPSITDFTLSVSTSLHSLQLQVRFAKHVEKHISIGDDTPVTVGIDAIIIVQLKV